VNEKKKTERTFFKKKWLYVLLSIAALITALTLSLQRFQTVEKENTNTACDVPVGEIYSGVRVQQSISVQKPISTISIFFATYARENSGTVEIFFIGEDSNTIYCQEQLPAEAFLDNTFVNFKMSRVITSRQDRVLDIIIRSDSEPGSAVTIWSSSADNIEGGTLTINDTVCPGDLGMQTFVKDVELLSVTVTVTMLLTVLALLAVGYVLFRPVIAYERLFAALVFGFGLLFLVVMTPFSQPDEAYHYNSAYRLSNYMLFQWGEEGELGDSADFPYDQYDVHSNTARGYLNGICHFFSKPQESETGYIPQPRGLTYFVDFIIPALGIALARLLSLNFIQLFLLGRLMNLLFYTVCVYYAVRRLPRFQLLLGLIALFPMALHQAASYSYDAFINGLAFLLIASILKAIWEEGPLPKKDFWIICVCGTLLAPAKIIYLPIIFLIWLIPKERFKSRGNKAMQCCCITAACILFMLIFSLPSIRSLSEEHTTTNWEGEVNYSLSFVFEHPIETVRIFLNTIREKGKWYFTTMVGSCLSGLSLPMPSEIAWGFAVVAFCAGFFEKKERFWDVRFASIALAVVVLLLAMTSMFLCWTSTTRSSIEGVQGRYLLPAAPLLFLSLSVRIPKLKEEFGKYLLIPCIGLEYVTILTVMNYTINH